VLRFHHLGLACSSLDAEASFLELVGYRREGEDFVDPVQGVIGRFLTGPGPRLELLAETGDSGVLRPWLARGVKIYHQAFVASRLSHAIQKLERGGARLVTGPVPATAFSGRRICFLMLPNRMLVELIEQGAR
jgi:methylmalonyl-CoA/ethylmalonyl-CoA epimerase